MRLTVTVDNAIGAERSAVLLRDEARILDHFARSDIADWDGRRLQFDGNRLGVPLRATGARIEPGEEVARLTVRYRFPRSLIALRRRRDFSRILRSGLFERFGRPCDEKSRKVFCVGFQRTGTTSILDALRILGYFGIHHAPWLLPGLEAGEVDWSLIDEYDAFADNPFPLLYRQLDERYPGSKFVLTVRDTESWLDSVRYLVEELAPHFPMERHIYGVDGFDRARFRERYEAHNRDVRAYFASRPDSLVVVDVTSQDPWSVMCPFLDEPRPSEPFPRSGLSIADSR